MFGPFTILAIYALVANTLALPQSEVGIAPTVDLLKRELDTGLYLAMWEQLNCPGRPTATTELPLSTNMTLAQSFRAYKVSRPTASREQLDFSAADPRVLTPAKGAPADKCAKFVEKISGSPVLLKGHCYQLTGGVLAQVGLLACPVLWAEADLFSASTTITRPHVF